MKKAIFFDIDGTLIDCMEGKKEISKRVQEAIYRLQANGNYIFIATGRPYAFLSKEILEFGFDGFIVANGAQIIINKDTVYSDAINQEFVRFLIREFDKNKIQYILEGEKECYLYRQFQECYNFYKKVGVNTELLKREFSLDSIKVLKVETICPSEEIAIQCQKLLNEYIEYGYYSSISPINFELYKKCNSKGAAIKKVLERLEISLEESFAFGDGMNDIDMLSTVGCGIAMGNASELVKKSAKFVTGTVYEDGVAKGIEEIILK